MNSKEKTIHKLIDSISILLSNEEIDKITVGQITSNCNITRQIFYRYFKDKYDLINYIYCQDKNKFLHNKSETSFCTYLTQLITFLYNKKNFYLNALQSNDSNSLKFTLYEDVKYYIITTLNTKNIELSDNVIFQIDFYCNQLNSQIVKELSKKNTINITTYCNSLIVSLPTQLYKNLT